MIIQDHGITFLKRSAPGGQLTLKDDSDAKITKGPKMKEKKLKSDKPDPSEEAQDLNKTKIIFQP